MFASSNYPPDQAAAERFVAEMRHGTLVACTPDGYPQVSILPFVKTDDVIELHCVQGDPTFDALRIHHRVTRPKGGWPKGSANEANLATLERPT